MSLLEALEMNIMTETCHYLDPSYAVSLSKQVETIGDAYCVAAGLHRKSKSHAKPIALMALKMMELSGEVLTPDGNPIKVICIFSGLKLEEVA